jgi:hypothetical protein
MRCLLLVLVLGIAGAATAGPGRAQRSDGAAGAPSGRGRSARVPNESDAAQKPPAPEARESRDSTDAAQGGARAGAEGKTASSAKAARKPKLAILEIRSAGNVDAREVSGLAGLIAAEAGRFDVQVIAGSDLSALVGLEKQKQLLGCSEGICLAEIGGALGVHFLLSAEVSHIGTVWLLSLALLDVAKARAVERVARKAPDMTGLVAAASEATGALVTAIAPRKAASTGPAAEAQPAPAPGIAADAVARSPSSGRRILAYSFTGAGVAALGGGVAFGLAAKSSYDKALQLSQAANASRSEVLSLRDRTTRQMWIADAFYGAGAVALGVGLYFAFTGNAEPQAAVAFAPLPGGGAALALAREF